MTRYVIRRLLQAIPLLLIISVMLFVLLQSSGDPLATMGGRKPTRPEDRARLARILGLDQPIYMQYLYWLIGNDWRDVDVDGDGIGDTKGTRKGVLRGDFGKSLVNKGTPVLEIILERLPNTLLLMIPAEILILSVSLAIGIYSALRQYSWVDQLVTTGSFIGYSMPIFVVALGSMYIFSVNFKKWGLPCAADLQHVDHLGISLQPLHTFPDIRGHQPGLYPYCLCQRIIGKNGIDGSRLKECSNPHSHPDWH